MNGPSTNKSLAYSMFSEGRTRSEVFMALRAMGRRIQWVTIKSYYLDWRQLMYLEGRERPPEKPKKKEKAPKRATASGCVFQGGESFWAKN